MTILSAIDLEVRYNNEAFLKKLNLTISEGEHVALVGRNGAGKSTLLRLLAGMDEPDDGEVTRRKGLRVGLLPQEFDLDDSLTIRENVLSGATEVQSLLAEYDRIDHSSPQAIALAETIHKADGWNLETRAIAIMDALNVPDADRMPDTLSGGEKRRAALSRALVGNPDVLILDEPTNHLDTTTIEWLETFLSRFNGTLLLVTHDRYFLDRVSNRILELSHGNVYSYQGNYTEFLLHKAEREAEARVHEQKRLSFIRRELDWVHRGPKARSTKSKGRLDRFWDAADQSPLAVEGEIELLIPTPPLLSKRVVDLKNVSFSYGDATLINGLSMELEAGNRIGILGPNGCGKTSLLRLILEELAPTSGNVVIGEQTRFNYIDQNRETLTPTNSLAEEIGEGNDFVMVGNTKMNIWSYLKRFLFEKDRIRVQVSELSGGERNRLLLAKQLKRGGNVLLLDEPTNDLDLPSLRILEESLVSFPGCVLVVSHDRYFLNRVCTHMIGFEGEGKVVLHEGNYDYYVERRRLREQAADDAPKATVKERQKAAPKSRRFSYKEKQELAGMEERILKIEGRAEEIEAKFSEPDFYEKHGDQSLGLQQELEEARAEAARLYERWEELEAIKAAR